MELLYANNAAYTRPIIITEVFEDWYFTLTDFVDEVETHFDLATRNVIDLDTMKKSNINLLTNGICKYVLEVIVGIYEANTDTIRGVII